MAEAAGQAHKKGEGNHDGCADCIRQKKENEAFIQIYERLQEVDKRTSHLTHALSQHQHASDTNRSFYHAYEQKVLNLPKSIRSSGYDIAASILEKEAKNKLVDENKKLKEMLFKMQREKYAALTQRDTPRLENRPLLNASTKMRDPLSQSFNSEMSSYESLFTQREDHFPKEEGRKAELQRMNSSQETSESCQSNVSTQSSSFTAKMRNSMDLSKYNDLNLWLYQNEKNTKLEQELYIVKEKPRSSAKRIGGLPTKRTDRLLPSLKK